jgi:hypothetical protein
LKRQRGRRDCLWLSKYGAASITANNLAAAHSHVRLPTHFLKRQNIMTEPEKFLDFIFREKTDDEVICVSKASPSRDDPKSTLFWNVSHEHDKFTNWSKRPHRARQAWYFCVSTVNGELNEKGTALRRRRIDLVRYHCLIFDDIGTKAVEPPIEPAWKIESSEENYQWGYLLEPGDDWTRYEAFLEWAHDQGWGDSGAGGSYRVMRIPGSANLKPGRDKFLSKIDYVDDTIWNLDELAMALGISQNIWEEYASKLQKKTKLPASASANIDPALDWLSANGYVVKDDGGHWVYIKCPWAVEHTSGPGTAGYSPLGRGDGRWEGRRAFKCMHEHCKDRHLGEFRDWAQQLGAPAMLGHDPLPVLQAKYIYVVEGKTVVNMLQRPKGGKWRYALDEWSNKYYQRILTPYRDNPVLIRTAFLEHDDTRQAEALAYMPGKGELTVLNGQNVVNTYVEPQHEETDKTPEVFLKHIEYLLPDQREREVFLNWLAWKIQHPGKRSYAIIMVADEAYGTGRSWIGEMMAEVLEGKVNKATLGQLIGKGTAGENTYNDWAAECQFLIVEEAKDLSREDFWSSYETIKERIDNRLHKFWRNTKYGAARFDYMYFNALIFSNHTDAMVLPEDDRRFCVLTNPEHRLDRAYYAQLQLSLDTDEPARVYWYLKRRNVSDFDHVYPPMTDAKQAMIEQSRSSLDDILDYLEKDFIGDIVTRKLLQTKVSSAARELGYEKIKASPGGIATKVWRRLGSLRPEEKNGARYVIDTERTEVRAFRNNQKWKTIDAQRIGTEITEELKRNTGNNVMSAAFPNM